MTNGSKALGVVASALPIIIGVKVAGITLRLLEDQRRALKRNNMNLGGRR